MPSTDRPATRPQFAVHVAADDLRARVRLVGELDVASLAQAEAAIARAERQEPRVLEIDLSGLEFMDSSGLRLLLGVRARAAGRGQRLLLRAGTPAVQRVFDVTALGRCFEFVG
jgi:anti-sigma B factor antagonist